MEIIINQELITKIFISCSIGILTYLYLRMLATMSEDHNQRKRIYEASKIYNIRKNEFEYKKDEEGWKKWKYMNPQICGEVEGYNYY